MNCKAKEIFIQAGGRTDALLSAGSESVRLARRRDKLVFDFPDGSQMTFTETNYRWDAPKYSAELRA